MADSNTAALSRRAGGTWRPGHNRWAIAGTVTIATSMELLDSSIVNIALPSIAGSLSVAQDQSTWVLTAYLISSAIVIPLSGWLAFRLGRKRYYMGSVTGFTISSLLCGLAPDLRFLILFRVLQGAAGGGLGPSEQSILVDTFPRRTAIAFAVYGMVIVLAPTLGPTLGGYITDHFGWRWIFFINVPIGFISLYLSNRMIADPPYMRTSRFSAARIDYTGLALLAVGLGSLQVVLNRGPRLDWFQSGIIVALTSLAGFALITVLIWERHQHNPILELKLFRYRNFAIAFVMMGVLAAMLYGTLLMIPEFLQLMLDFSAEQAGAVLWPTVLAIVPLLLVIALLLSYVDARVLIVLGFLITSFSIFHVVHKLTLSIDSMNATMFVVYEAAGLTFLFVPITTLAYTRVPREENNAISSLLNFSRNIGGSFGICFVTTELTRRAQYHQSVLTSQATLYNPHLHSFVADYYQMLRNSGAGSSEAFKLASGNLYHTVIRQAVVLSYIDTFWILGVITLFTTALAFFMLPDKRRRASGALGVMANVASH
ncbi:MAG TPA: DHA2 family efflux MFS transporter permease subunit [Candidatus Binataceae bacterium]|nr:DHA2 family efflux MFS transporter permease subunit [Candidatus Binataceae bacterium]